MLTSGFLCLNSYRYGTGRATKFTDIFLLVGQDSAVSQRAAATGCSLAKTCRSNHKHHTGISFFFIQVFYTVTNLLWNTLRAFVVALDGNKA
jgi:hypothetical protein